MPFTMNIGVCWDVTVWLGDVPGYTVSHPRRQKSKKPWTYFVTYILWTELTADFLYLMHRFR
jgi:hypothetical protein